MSNAAIGAVDGYSDEVSSSPRPLRITVPDAERLLLQSRFIRNQFEAEIQGDLEMRIRGARLLDPFAVPPDLVTMNSQVILRDVDTGRPYILTLAFPSCGNWRKGRISVFTPLGSTLLGAHAGQTLNCPNLGADCHCYRGGSTASTGSGRKRIRLIQILLAKHASRCGRTRVFTQRTMIRSLGGDRGFRFRRNPIMMVYSIPKRTDQTRRSSRDPQGTYLRGY